eukprot:SAG31_NODE_40062_length_283_cov_1.119565_1_plen_25_part_10
MVVAGVSPGTLDNKQLNDLILGFKA